MCRYSAVAHAYGAYTVRDKFSGDIITLDFNQFRVATDARDLAVSITNALEHAHNSGIEKGALEQRAYERDSLLDAADEARALNTPIETHNPVRYGYPSGNTSKQAEIVERWREQNK